MFESGDKEEITESNFKTVDISLHEHLFQQLNELYNHPKNGLISIGQNIGVDVLPPKKKVTILLIGNHSAGKSSFINWYIEDNVQRTGMAIETQSFSVVASGRRRETLMGPATIFLFPHLKPLEKMEGVTDYLNAEISTSKKRQFSMITFIDTPGLVDGGMEYPYNVNDAILFLGGVADLIFVFFDPIGLALCKRTMLVVEKINSLYPEKVHFYLSKSDEIRKQTDKQKIMMQITQEVCRHAGLNRSGFTMPGIYIPTLARNPVVQKQLSTSVSIEKSTSCQTGESLNEVEEVCKQIEQKISQNLQTALNNLDKDISDVFQTVIDRLISNMEISQRNRTYFLFSSVAVILFLGILFLTGLQYSIEKYGLDFLSSNFHVHQDLLQHLTTAVNLLLSLSAIENKNYLYTGYFILFIIALYFINCMMRLQPTLPRREVRELERLKVFIVNYLMKKKVELTQEYLKDSYDL